MDINGLTRTAPQPGAAPLNAAALQPATKAVAESEAKATAPQMSISATAAAPPFTRPAPTERVTNVEPPTTGGEWDKTLERALNNMPDARSWQAISRGLGQLSQYSAIEQRATTRLTPRTEGAAEAKIISQSSLGRMSFSATLASGTTVTFSVNARAGLEQAGGALVAFRSIDVQFSSDAELTEEEQAELDELSKHLGAFVGDFVSDGEPDLSRLKLAESSAIESLQLNLHTADEQTLSLYYTRNAKNTVLEMNWNGRSLDLTIQRGETSHQELAGLRETLLEYLDKARADSSDTKVLIQALSLFNASDDKTLTAQADKSAALLTGLPDYQLNFKGQVEYPSRRNEHHDKYSGIRLLSIGQSTHTETNNGATSISQIQNINLEAAYFTSLPHLEDVDLTRENFKWHQLDESLQILSQQTWKNDRIENASVQRLASIQNLQQTWSEGKLIDERRDEQQDINTTDVLFLLKAANESSDSYSKKQAKEKLNDLLHPLY